MPEQMASTCSFIRTRIACTDWIRKRWPKMLSETVPSWRAYWARFVRSSFTSAIPAACTTSVFLGRLSGRGYAARPRRILASTVQAPIRWRFAAVLDCLVVV